MKPFKFSYLLIFACLISLCSCDSCDDELDVLPPETQTGAHTFGCMVNGRVFRNYGAFYFGQPNLYAIYMRNMNTLNVYALNSKSNESFFISYCFDSSYSQYDTFTYTIDKTPFATSNLEGLNLTKFDTINKIVSGRFSFLLNSENKVQKNITNGVFDIELNINE